MVFILSLCTFCLRSCLPVLLPSLFHHVCVVLLEDHLYQTFKPFQRGTDPIKMHIFTACLYISVGINWQLLKNGLLPMPVLPAKGWKRALWKGREARIPARDPLESCEQSASLHPHRSRRYLSPHLCPHFLLFTSSLNNSRDLSLQPYVTVTAVRWSSLTGVITAPPATCKAHLFHLDTDKFKNLFKNINPLSCVIGVCWRWITIAPGMAHTATASLFTPSCT